MTIVVLLASVVACRGQEPSNTSCADSDKVRIIEAVLDLELRNQQTFPDLANIRNVSPDNIEFMESSELSKHGFALVAANQLCELQNKRVMQYLFFKRICLRGDVAIIGLSRVTGGRACFGGRFYSELRYTYEARRTSDGWVAQLTRRPMPSFFSGLKRSNIAPGTP